MARLGASPQRRVVRVRARGAERLGRLVERRTARARALVGRSGVRALFDAWILRSQHPRRLLRPERVILRTWIGAVVRRLRRRLSSWLPRRGIGELAGAERGRLRL